jgi:nucleoid-associated protein YgaU
VKRGDTLWDLARAYLCIEASGSTIYRLNTDQIEGPPDLSSGEVRAPRGMHQLP